MDLADGNNFDSFVTFAFPPLDITNIFVNLGPDEHIRSLATKDAMPRNPSSQLNDVELAILRVVWNRKACTVRDVHEALQPEAKPGTPARSR